MRRSAAGIAAVAVVLAAPLAGPASGAEPIEVDPQPRPAPAQLIELVDSAVEANVGAGASSLNNDGPTTWVAEEASVLEPDEVLRYRFYSYVFSASLEGCSEADLRVEMDVTADGPDVGLNDNMFFGVLDGDDGFGGGSTVGPGDVGDTATLEASFRSTAAGVEDGVIIFYGATTFQRPDTSSGYSFGPPRVELVADDATCPPAPTPAPDPGVDPDAAGAPATAAPATASPAGEPAAAAPPAAPVAPAGEAQLRFVG